MVHLPKLIKNQLAVLKSKGKRRCTWHPEVLELCCAIYSCRGAAYAELAESGLAALPSYDHIRKLCQSGSLAITGQDPVASSHCNRRRSVKLA